MDLLVGRSEEVLGRRPEGSGSTRRVEAVTGLCLDAGGEHVVPGSGAAREDHIARIIYSV